MSVWWKKHWFSLTLFLSPALAWAWPWLGSAEGPLHTDVLNKIAIALIFMISGMTVRLRVLLRTAGKLRFHFKALAFCFLFFPFVVLILQKYFFIHLHLDPHFVMGISILSVLPTTSSSCVVLTHSAKGDEAAALFNAVVSNLLGIFLCPILLVLVADLDDQPLHLDPWPIISSLTNIVLLPLLLGHLLHGLFRQQLNRGERFLRQSSRSLVVFLTYTVFCDSLMDLSTVHSPLLQIVGLCALMFFLHLFFLWLSYEMGRVFNFSVRERKALLFIAPQKTLVLGMPITILIVGSDCFQASHTELALYALPLVVYHQIQLLLTGVYIPVLKKWQDPRPPQKKKESGEAEG